MYFVCEFGLLFVELSKTSLRKEVALGLDYTDEFLDLPRHLLELATTENNMAVEWGKERALSKVVIFQHAMHS